MDDVLLNKANIIENCMKRINHVYENNPDNLENDLLKQESIILNIQRACEAAIDMGTRVIRMKKLSIPQSSRDVFAILEKENILPNELSKNLQAMVGFRNIAIHEYQDLNIKIVQSIIENRLNVFKHLIKLILE